MSIKTKEADAGKWTKAVAELTGKLELAGKIDGSSINIPHAKCADLATVIKFLAQDRDRREREEERAKERRNRKAGWLVAIGALLFWYLAARGLI